MTDLLMPKLGTDMADGTLIAWHKKPGDAVRRGDVVAEVETDKGVIDIEIFTSGILDRLLIQPGQRVPVGTALATVREEGAVSVPPPPAPAPAARPPSPVVVPPPAPVAMATRAKISPSARDLARKLGVDPSQVQGTGPRGAITREDIERAAVAPTVVAPAPAPAVTAPPAAPTVAAPPPAPAAVDRTARMRQSIAAAMARSKRDIPHYYLSTSINMQRALAWLAEANLKRPITDRLLYGVLLLKAAALALREVPELNAVWSEDHVVPNASIHIGVAISLRKGGLIAPALHDTDRQSLDELMRNFKDLVTRARAGSLRSSELADPTITVTSLGEQGVESVFGIIYPPQVALVGFGKILERPWSVAGQIVSRPIMTATLSADHRVSDGHRAGLFLAAVDRLLQEPEKL